MGYFSLYIFTLHFRVKLFLSGKDAKDITQSQISAQLTNYLTMLVPVFHLSTVCNFLMHLNQSVCEVIPAPHYVATIKPIVID